MKPLRDLILILGLVFPVLLFYFSKDMILQIVLGVGLFFVLVDGSRFVSKRFNNYVFSRFESCFDCKEEKHISSYSWFMISCYIVIASFSPEIALVSLSFISLGMIVFNSIDDVCEGYLLFENKMLDDVFSYLMICLFIGSVLRLVINIGFWEVLFGSIVSSLIILVPIKIDKMILVSLASAAVMTYIVSL